MAEIRRAGVLLAMLSLLGPIPGHAADRVPDYVAAAIADPARPSQQVAHDADRKPGALLTFAGVKPGDRVADFMSGGAYFTRLFSRIVGKTGHVYAFLPDEQLKNCAPEETTGTRAIEHDGSYANVSVLTGPVARFRAPEPLDLSGRRSISTTCTIPSWGPPTSARSRRRCSTRSSPGASCW